MGTAIGVALIALTISSFILISRRASRMSQRYNDQWTIDPQTGRPVPPDQGPGQFGGHHGSSHHGGGHHGSGHGGGFSGGGGGHHGGFSGGDGGGGGGGGHHG